MQSLFAERRLRPQICANNGSETTQGTSIACVLQRESTSRLIGSIGSSGTSDSRESRFFNPIVPQESLRTRLSSGLQSLLVALHLATPHASVHYVLDSDSGSKSVLELGAVAEHKAHTKIVHASIINKDEIDICKLANGEDWLLGMGSYGMVRPDACNSNVHNATRCNQSIVYACLLEISCS